MVGLKNCEPELSYILAELFSMCLMQFYFEDCWEPASVAPVSKNTGERCMARKYRPVSLLSVVRKVFKKLVNIKLFDHLKNCGLLFYF